MRRVWSDLLSQGSESQRQLANTVRPRHGMTSFHFHASATAGSHYNYFHPFQSDLGLINCCNYSCICWHVSDRVTLMWFILITEQNKSTTSEIQIIDCVASNTKVWYICCFRMLDANLKESSSAVTSFQLVTVYVVEWLMLTSGPWTVSWGGHVYIQGLGHNNENWLYKGWWD